MTTLLESRDRLVSLPSTPDPILQPAPPRSRWLVPFLLMLLATFAAVASTGFLEADEITHLLNSQKVWTDWRAVLSIWGRLGCTAFYAPAAPFGLTAARLMAVGITILVGIGTTRLLRHFVPREASNSWLTRHATAVVWLLLFAQPMFALNSFTVMTEMLLACTWVWAAVVLIKCRQWRGRGVVLASAVLGLGGLMRPEGWLAVACWPAFVWIWLSLSGGDLPLTDVLRKRIAHTLIATYVAGAPSLLWYMLGVYGFGDWAWIVQHWPWAPASPYGKTGTHFLFSTVVSMGGWMWPLIALGAFTLLRTTWREHRATRAEATANITAREGFLLLVLPLFAVFAVHGILGSLGLFGSMSLPRYFLCVAPMAAVLAVLGGMGVEVRVRRSRWRRRSLRAALVGMPVLTLLALIATGFLPMWKLVSTARMELAAEEIRRRIDPMEYEGRLTLGHPYLIYRLNMELGTDADRRVFSEKAMATAAPGTLLVIHQNLWTKEGRWNDAQLRAWGYREDEAFASQADRLTEWHPLTLERGDLARVRIWVKR